MFHLMHRCDDNTAEPWSYVYLTGKLRSDFTDKHASCQCGGSWGITGGMMPLAAGVYDGGYMGASIKIVLGYRCPAVLSGRIAYANEVSSIADPQAWVSTNSPHAPGLQVPVIAAGTWYDTSGIPSRPFLLELMAATIDQIKAVLRDFYIADLEDGESPPSVVVNVADAYGDFKVSTTDESDPILYISLRDQDARILGLR